MAAVLRQPASTRDLVLRAVDLVAERLPAGWSTELQEDAIVGRRRADGLLRVSAPEGSSTSIIIEAKRRFETRDAAPTVEQLQALRAELGGDEPSAGLIAATYLSPAARTRLAELGVGYADATGNLRVQLDRPALFLRDVGEDRDPWRGPGRPRGSFKGGPAARVFRALADFRPPYSVPQLVKLSEASSGVAYRVVAFLQREDVVRRDPELGIAEVDWRQLIERWSREYGFALSTSTAAFLDPRGIEATEKKLSASDLRYAVTSSSAARFYAPYAPVRSLSVYVTSIDEAADTLGLRPATDGGGNVLLAVPEDQVAFERTRTIEDLVVAAPSQIATDLLGGPGRAPEEGRVLLEWMIANESAWRQ